MQDSNRVTDSRVAIVTGASGGLGFEIARQLALRGIKVVVTARGRQRAEQAASKLAVNKLQVVPHGVDVDLQSSVDSIARVLETDFGRVDILVNNAAVYYDEHESATAIDLQVVKKTLETNLLGAWRMCRAVIPLMKRNSYGRIVNISSHMGGFEELAESGGGSPAYRLSKVSLNALTLLLASELRGTNILINSCHPGWIKTKLGGPNAPGTAEEGADTPVWLATLPNGGPSGEFFDNRKRRSW